MLIAEDLLLLLTDDDSGKPGIDGTKLDFALAGAVLVELTLAGAVDLAGPQEAVKEGRLVIRASSSRGDDVLDEGLGRLERKVGKKPQDAVASLTKGLRGRLYEKLTQRGIVQAERDKVLGIFPEPAGPLPTASTSVEYVPNCATSLSMASPRTTVLEHSSRCCRPLTLCLKSSTHESPASTRASSTSERRRSPRASGRLKGSAKRSKPSMLASRPPLLPQPLPAQRPVSRSPHLEPGLSVDERLVSDVD